MKLIELPETVKKADLAQMSAAWRLADTCRNLHEAVVRRDEQAALMAEMDAAIEAQRGHYDRALAEFRHADAECARARMSFRLPS